MLGAAAFNDAHAEGEQLSLIELLKLTPVGHIEQPPRPSRPSGSTA
jgi:hypothetical protein